VSEPVRLHPADLDRLADLVADRVADALAERQAHAVVAEPAPLLTAAQVAERFGVSPEWARDHADDLGAIRLGGGPRGRLRFDPDTVAEALAARPGSERSPAPDRPLGGRKTMRARPVDADGCPLLPIRGREAVE